MLLPWTIWEILFYFLAVDCIIVVLESRSNKAMFGYFLKYMETVVTVKDTISIVKFAFFVISTFLILYETPISKA